MNFFRGNDIIESSIINQEIFELRSEIASLKVKEYLTRDPVKENLGFKKVLNITNDSIDIICGKVNYYNKEIFKMYCYCTIRDSIENLINSPVISFHGLVGIVDKHEGNSLRIKLISHPDIKVPVWTGINRYSALLEPENERFGRLMELTTTKEVFRNETIFTSPYSDYYVENIPVGIITDFENSPATIHKEVEVKFIENIYALDHVFVLRKK